MLGILVLLQFLTAPSGLLPSDQDAVQAVVIGIEGLATGAIPGEDIRELRVGDLLDSGTLIMPAPDGRVHLYLRNGQPVQVTSETEIPPVDGDVADGFIRIHDLLLRFAARTPADSISGPERDESPLPIQPANGIPVRVLTPTLHWHPTVQADRFRVSIWEEGSDPRSFEVVGDSFAVLPSDAALTPGGTYEWSVESIPQQDPAPRLRFRVLDREGMDRVANGLRELRETGLDPESGGALPALALFLEMDLIYDAAAALEQIASGAEGRLSPALEVLQSHLRMYRQPVPVGGGAALPHPMEFRIHERNHLKDGQPS